MLLHRRVEHPFIPDVASRVKDDPHGSAIQAVAAPEASTAGPIRGDAWPDQVTPPSLGGDQCRQAEVTRGYRVVAVGQAGQQADELSPAGSPSRGTTRTARLHYTSTSAHVEPARRRFLRHHVTLATNETMTFMTAYTVSRQAPMSASSAARRRQDHRAGDDLPGSTAGPPRGDDETTPDLATPTQQLRPCERERRHPREARGDVGRAVCVRRLCSFANSTSRGSRARPRRPPTAPTRRASRSAGSGTDAPRD